MKRIIYYAGIISIALSLTNCAQNGPQQITGVSSYDALYRDSFDILLHSETPPYSRTDTLYTEMYIALKAIRNGESNQCAKMVCEKVDELMKIDTATINQIDYLEAKLIAQAVLKDKKGAVETCFRQYNLYPENSFERLGSLGSLFLALNQKDSANYYLNRCYQISKENLDSESDDIKEKSILGILHSLVLLNKDEEAKDFIEEQLNSNPPKDIKELLISLENDFENFKQKEWLSVTSLFKNF